MNNVYCFRLTSILLCSVWMWSSGLSGQPAMAQTKPAPSRKDKGVHRETVVLPIRYVDGGRLVRLLKMFVPEEDSRYTLVHYSPFLNKLLVRARPVVVKKLQEASRQLDVAQTQFDVNVYFLKAVDKTENRDHQGALFSFLSQKFPSVRSWSTVGEVHLRTINHQEAEVKTTEQGMTSEPTLRVVLHQGPVVADEIQVRLHLFHHEAFRTVSKHGANTQFIKATQLRNQFLVRPDQFVVVGSVPWKTTSRWNERVAVVIKIGVIPSSSQNTSAGHTTAQPNRVPHAVKTGSLDKNSIRQVVNQNKATFKQCYEQMLQRQPMLKGRLVVSFVIAPSGDTTTVALKSSTLNNKQVEDCVLRAFATFKFPHPTGGGVVRVNYPLMFSP